MPYIDYKTNTCLPYNVYSTDMNCGNVHPTGDYVDGLGEGGLEKGHIANELSAVCIKGKIN